MALPRIQYIQIYIYILVIPCINVRILANCENTQKLPNFGCSNDSKGGNAQEATYKSNVPIEKSIIGYGGYV